MVLVPKTLAVTWVIGWLTVEAYGALVTIAEFGGLTDTAASFAAVATIIASITVIGVTLRRAWRQVRRIGQAITTVLGLDTKLDEHRVESRTAWQHQARAQEQLEGRVAGLERTVEVYGTGERAAVRGALEAVATPITPRPARASDPDPSNERVFFRE